MTVHITDYYKDLLNNEILLALTSIIKDFPRDSNLSLRQIVGEIWEALVRNAFNKSIKPNSQFLTDFFWKVNDNLVCAVSVKHITINSPSTDGTLTNIEDFKPGKKFSVKALQKGNVGDYTCDESVLTRCLEAREDINEYSDKQILKLKKSIGLLNRHYNRIKEEVKSFITNIDRYDIYCCKIVVVVDVYRSEVHIFDEPMYPANESDILWKYVKRKNGSYCIQPHGFYKDKDVYYVDKEEKLHEYIYVPENYYTIKNIKPGDLSTYCKDKKIETVYNLLNKILE